MQKRRFLVKNLPTQGKPVKLSPDEARHATKVLRLDDGSEVMAMDGRGGVCLARLATSSKANVVLHHVRDSAIDLKEYEYPIVIELAVLKGPAMHLAIEKCVELGVRELVPVFSEHGVVKAQRKEQKMQERWQKIADQALKQCERPIQMKVAEPTTLVKLLSKPTPESERRYWCAERSGAGWPSVSPLQTTRFLIGPEGGWSDKEQGLLAAANSEGRLMAASLGPAILRAETAAIFCASLVKAKAISLLDKATIEKGN